MLERWVNNVTDLMVVSQVLRHRNATSLILFCRFICNYLFGQRTRRTDGTDGHCLFVGYDLHSKKRQQQNKDELFIIADSLSKPLNKESGTPFQLHHFLDDYVDTQFSSSTYFCIVFGIAITAQNIASMYTIFLCSVHCTSWAISFETHYVMFTFWANVSQI